MGRSRSCACFAFYLVFSSSLLLSTTPAGAASSAESGYLQVLVPNITSFRQFVNCSDPSNVTGYSVDVFTEAVRNFSSTKLNFTCFNFNPNKTGPGYDAMIAKLAANGSVYDAVVGDVTIGAQRLSMVDFSQPYLQSGIVMLVKASGQQPPYSPWTFFFAPFTARMWGTVIGAFVLTGGLLWLLERNTQPQHEMQTVGWFVAEALILLQRESIRSTVARILMVAWVFFVLLLGASYTAGLSSFLTAAKLSPMIPDINTLKQDSVKIGYRTGSIVEDYLRKRFQIPQTNLISLRNLSEFTGNLTDGGVAAVVDEVPYVNLYLSLFSPSDCNFEVAGVQLTSEGFGFAFRKGSNWTEEVSKAILRLSESGRLGFLQTTWNLDGQRCSPPTQSTQITFKSSLALFIPLGLTSLICLTIHYAKRWRHPKNDARVPEFEMTPQFS